MVFQVLSGLFYGYHVDFRSLSGIFNRFQRFQSVPEVLRRFQAILGVFQGISGSPEGSKTFKGFKRFQKRSRGVSWGIPGDFM